MIIENRTPWYSDAEVAAVVRQGMAGGPQPKRVLVLPRSLPSDTRLGFTPFDHRLPTKLWVEPPWRYPQGVKAKSWREELLLSAAHEVYHFRHGGRCPRGECERDAETSAMGRLHTLERGRERRWFRVARTVRV